jgi:hypothetical protein
MIYGFLVRRVIIGLAWTMVEENFAKKAERLMKGESEGGNPV